MPETTPTGGETAKVIHDLKVWPAFFERLLDGTKTFEVRKDDRGYQCGDVLRLREWQPDSLYGRDSEFRYTGRELRAVIGFTFKAGFGFDLGNAVVLSLLQVERVS